MSPPQAQAPEAEPVLDPAGIAALREACAGYTVDAVHDVLGLDGTAALDRADLTGAAYALRGDDSRLADLVRLFLLGAEVDEDAAARAVAPLDLGIAVAAGLVERSVGGVRAGLDVRPYAQSGADAPLSWWVVSDLGSDVRRGPLPAGHVLGVGAAALTLAQAVPRTPVERALDLGTGCGVQALHLGRHTRDVTATDVSPRALRLAATTAALSGEQWTLRHGSLLEPVYDERFDLIVANPPFVVSDGSTEFDYRDSGMAGDAVSEILIRTLPAALRGGGSAHLLANWIIDRDAAWDERVGGWLAGSAVDAWVRQREVVEPGEYVTMWLRDAGFDPSMPEWADRYAAWRAWFDAHGVLAIGMGQVSLWQTDERPVRVLEDVAQAVEQPLGAHLDAWRARQRWLAGHGDDAALLQAVLAAGPGLARERSEVLDDGGWTPAGGVLRQRSGLRWSVEVDDAIAALIAGCDGRRPLRLPVLALAAALDQDADAVAAAALPVVRDLVSRGFLVPVTDARSARMST
ncbi:methyltransferase [uncultured Jatrophihabitans sp.]|uniref:DUF7782 domain-containing protein n=1 Tax=uncultured Jatrophihabitans sp. TaxID=1610747 RepID=UPI0035CC5181